MKFRGNEVTLSIVFEGLLWSFFISIIMHISSLDTVFKIITPLQKKKSYDKNLIINSLNLALSLENKFIPVKCWKKSMLLFRVLKKYGYEPKIHFGISYNYSSSDSLSKEKILFGHSWITLNNTPLFDTDTEITKNLTEILTYP